MELDECGTGAASAVGLGLAGALTLPLALRTGHSFFQCPNR
uniref:Uncharacterized protein n=1 Tax=Anguilla anguilla TaxID=7936 RepID=A0A0E9WEN5_ANGAN